MVDNFSILISHALLLIAAWRLINRPDLDEETPPEQDKEPEGFFHQRKSAQKTTSGKAHAPSIGEGGPHA